MGAAARRVASCELLWLLLVFQLARAASQRVLQASSFVNAEENATFDYVVVGGGTAGLAIAHRLVESGSKRVAVVEAGGYYEQENGNISVIPAYNQKYNDVSPESQWNAPLIDWGFLTTPQLGAAGQQFHYGRGKMLGGCSAQNALNYNRPTKGTLKAWAEAVGDPSYLWDAFLPFFQKITYFNPNASVRALNASVPHIYDPSSGPLSVSHPNWAAPFSSWAQRAFRELGIEDVHDLIHGKLIGSQYSPLTLNPKDQTRDSSETAFISTYATNGAVKVYTHSLAKKVLFDNSKTAQGVVVQNETSKKVFVLSAEKEVILSAGAFQSPQLLMVSGVGPSEVLKPLKIDVVADRPGVGRNMWDHVVLTFGHQVNVDTFGRMMDSEYAAHAEAEYLANRTGILTNDMSDYLGWENLPPSFRTRFSAATEKALAQFPVDWPEIEYEVSSAPFGTPSFSTPENAINVGYFQAVLLTPLSRGNVSITSDNMDDPPLIDPNWLTDPVDKDMAIAAFRRGRQLFKTKAIAPVLIGDELVPGLDVPLEPADEEILAYLQKNFGFNWHACCTSAMGRTDDKRAVVDSRARVIGVRRLRVVDASAFPLLPPGHPQATVYALAEKIAHDIIHGED